MAGLMQRASLIVRAKFSKFLNRAENPTETLDYSYEQMQEQLQNVKRGVADVVTAKKRLELQTQKLEQNVVKLETQARQAVAANREDLARQALERKAAAQQQLQGLDDQIKQLSDQQEKLVAGQQQLETRIEAFRSQKEVMKAQYSAAEYCALSTSFWERKDSTRVSSCCCAATSFSCWSESCCTCVSSSWS